MKRRLRWFGLAFLVAAPTGCGGDPGETRTGPASPPEPDAEVGQARFAQDERTELWFVEFEQAPTARGGDADVHKNERARFRSKATEAGLRYRERFSFHGLWNGLSIRVGQGGAAKLARMPGVKALYPVVPITIDDVRASSTSDPDLFSAVAMSGADVAHTKLGLTGEGVRVGIIDTGVDYHHPDLGGCFGPGCRVVYGYDFVGDNYDGADPSSHEAPDNDPDDCAGHGTHVAGIIGANGAVHGVAPGVTLGAYRVFGCRGSTSSDVLIKAMEKAKADGMNVVNMSIGSAFQWPSYPTAVAADALVESGVVVVTSIGNNGDKGLWAAGAPGVGDRVIGTASVDNVRTTNLSFHVSPDGVPVAYARALGAPPAPLSGSAPLVRTGTPTSSNDACDTLAAGSLTGAAALIRRGGCAFSVKAANAQTAGAAYVVLYNNVAGAFSPTVVGSTPIHVPVVAISKADGELLDARVAAGAVTQTWTDQVVSRANPTGNQLSTFSSYGLTAALTFKPDLAAPGGEIYSTVPLALGSYDTYSGTSMASPHVAGAVALLLSAQPGLPPARVRDLLQNTAVPEPWSGDLAAGVPDNTHRQGAGLIRIDRAIQATTVISPGSLAIGESQAGPFTATLRLSNAQPVDVTYVLSHVPAVSTTNGDHWAPTNAVTGAATVAFSEHTVTVPANGKASVRVTITASQDLTQGSLFGGYLVFTPAGGTSDDALRVPYSGFKGDYQSIQALTPADQSYPWLGKKSGDSYTQLTNGGTFTLEGNDLPYVVLHIDHSVARITLDVLEPRTSRSLGRALELSYIGQNTSPTDTSEYPWDGTATVNGTTTRMPNGTYVLKLSALKALGDPNNPAHWETWTSPSITLRRP